VALLTAGWPYQVAASREALAPDGTRQVFAGQVEGRPAILVRPLGSDRGVPLAVLEAGQVSSPAWSPTGAQIAFVATASGSPQVWLVGSDGTGLRQLTADEWGSASQPSFSPDGNRLVYASAGVDGRRQIWILALDGTARANISNNVHDEWAPVWAK
jgi:Tol biopolymer transport system component